MTRFELKAWRLFEDNPRYKSGRLWRAGWHGSCITDVSSIEEYSIRDFWYSIPKSDIYTSFNRMLSSNIGEPEDTEQYTYREICVWLRRTEDHERLTKLIEGFPERVKEFPISCEDADGTLSSQHRSMLRKRGINFHIFKTTSKRYLSIEDCPEAALMFLIYG